MPRRKYYRKRSDHFNAYQKAWANENREKVRKWSHERHRRNRILALSNHGGKCTCCDISTYEFLAIDHINGGGTKERKTKYPNSQSFYADLAAHPQPEKYRVLCHNCNSALGYYGYCPHQI